MAERRVWIAQCLCPQRHCILAGTAEANDKIQAETEIGAPLRCHITSMVKSGLLNPWCALCHAPAKDWTYEVGRTRFASLAEATTTLRQFEAKQRLTNALWGDIPRSD